MSLFILVVLSLNIIFCHLAFHHWLAMVRVSVKYIFSLPLVNFLNFIYVFILGCVGSSLLHTGFL